MKAILQPDSRTEAVPLPSRKKLRVRARKVVSSFDGRQSLEEEKKDDVDEPPLGSGGDTPKYYGFTVLDQTDKHNTPQQSITQMKVLS